jgi:NAD(P)-dependent dehydrogenase (short-subunit alcohol dehydrogenase family)
MDKRGIAMADYDTGMIVVTGASSGIGMASALHLVDCGFHVFAGVRKESDGAALEAQRPGGITWVRLDVTDSEQIAAAAQKVADKAGERGLAGLLNNAGISINGPLEFLPIDDLRKQLDVNVIGQIAVTQAFLPLLRKARGRIVNMGSIAGRMSMAMGGPYSASKFAMEALTDTLRMELRSWGIEVIIIEPGAIQTAIWKKSLAAAEVGLQKMPAVMNEYYGPLIEKARNAAHVTARKAVCVDEVSRVVEHAFCASRPRARYIVGRDAKIQRLLTYLPDRWRDRVILKYLDSCG